MSTPIVEVILFCECGHVRVAHGRLKISGRPAGWGSCIGCGCMRFTDAAVSKPRRARPILAPRPRIFDEETKNG